MHYDPPLTFHHNFSEPVKIPGSYNLFYDPVKVDRILTGIMNGDAEYETSRKTSSTRR